MSPHHRSTDAGLGFLDMTTGAPAFGAEIPDVTLLGLADDGALVEGSGAVSLVELDGTGTERWSIDLPDEGSASYSGTHLVIADLSGSRRISAYDMTNGEALWTTELKDTQARVERVVGDSVIVAHGESGTEPSVVAYSLEDGTAQWTIEGIALEATTTSGSTLVIVGGSGEDDLVAIDLGPLSPLPANRRLRGPGGVRALLVVGPQQPGETADE